MTTPGTTDDVGDSASQAHPSEWPEGLPRTVHLPQSQQIAPDDTDDEITEKLRRQGARISKGTIAPAVFWPAMIVVVGVAVLDRKSTRLNSSHVAISYAALCLKTKSTLFHNA